MEQFAAQKVDVDKHHAKLIVLTGILAIIIIIALIFAFLQSRQSAMILTNTVSNGETSGIARQLLAAPSSASAEQVKKVSSLLAKTKEPTRAQKDTVATLLMQSQ